MAEPKPKSKPGKGHRFPKGVTRPASSGRKKGTPNKITKDVKAAILEGFSTYGTGGIPGVVRHFIKVCPEAACRLLGQLLPPQEAAANGLPLFIGAVNISPVPNGHYLPREAVAQEFNGETIEAEVIEVEEVERA